MWRKILVWLLKGDKDIVDFANLKHPIILMELKPGSNPKTGVYEKLVYFDVCWPNGIRPIDLVEDLAQLLLKLECGGYHEVILELLNSKVNMFGTAVDARILELIANYQQSIGEVVGNVPNPLIRPGDVFATKS